MFGPNVADKYSLVVTKNLGLGCNSQPCFASHFLIINSSFMQLGFHEIIFLCKDDFTFCPACYDLKFGLLPGAFQAALYCDWLSRPMH